ncbi:MAG: ABC transporter permease [Thermodesulfobacteriota bacterium]|jgi:phospholipid/cholesterol/gamma-HCH transport system permease protein|nr:MAG: ABC transporter permease [Thermodesulfobacteriota bacterium]
MENARFENAGRGELDLSQPTHDALLISFYGIWEMGNDLPSAEEALNKIETASAIRRVSFEAQNLSGWDTGLLTFLIKVIDTCTQKTILIDMTGLPQGVQRLLALASAVPERAGARKETTQEPFLSRIGTATIEFGRSLPELLAFIGEAFMAFLKLFTGKARFQRHDLWLIIQQTGVQALPIVSLICLLVGLILAFVGAVQLRMFGAQIYVADLVGIGMVRVLGAVMTGVIMAGRTGAAFAAELGTMQVNEEIDALRTLGIPPMEFLVLPRMLALMLMMPLLCLYADLMGLLGGLIVGVGMLNLNLMEYINETRSIVDLTNLCIGIFHGGVFGVLVALSGCLRGMQCGRSASAVGQATTSAVVTSIVCIVVATAVITLICDVLKI